MAERAQRTNPDLKVIYEPGNYLTLFVNVHQAAQRQSVLSLIQRTDSIGKTFRQHWHNAVCQINTGSTFQCFPVQSTVVLYIVAYICDMDSQMVNVPLFCQGNRIIQVFGIFAINSDCLQCPFAAMAAKSSS